MATNTQPRSLQQWSVLASTPADFYLDAGAYGLTVHATVYGTITLQRVLSDGASPPNIVIIPVSVAIAADGYTELHLPAGKYRIALSGITAFTGAIELIARGGG